MQAGNERQAINSESKTPIMRTISKSLNGAGLALFLATSVHAAAGTPAPVTGEVKQTVPAPPEKQWEFTLAMPSWLAATSGTIGLDGYNSHIYMGADTLLKHLDMTASLSAEARKGRFGIYGDFLYVKASDAVYSDGLIGKADLHLDQWLADLELTYRIVEGPKGYVDLRAGVRYTSVYNSIITNANNSAVNEASAKLVDEIGQKVADRLTDLDLKSHLQSVLVDRIQARLGRIDGLQADRPALAIAPIAGGRLSGADRRRIRRDGLGDEPAAAALVNELVRSKVNQRVDDLAAALRARAAARTDALRAEAQSRIDGLKSKLAGDIAAALKSKLATSASLEERWLDPYVGIATRYNLSKACYLTGKADIGGFGLGSEITCQASCALGCQITRSIFIEAGYRYLYTDYNQGGFLYDVTQSGAQITAGIRF
jgi:hypothetical protein